MAEITFSRNVKPNRQTNFRGKGNFVMNYTDESERRQKIVFRGGVYKTSDKQKIQKLLRSEELRRGIINLETPRELVNKYLTGDEPDKLTEELLAKVDDEGMQKIASSIGLAQRVHNNYPNVIRAMVIGEEITNEIERILQDHKSDTVEADKLKEFEESGRIYRSGPWYKFMIKDEESDKDLSLGKTKAEAHRWLAENKDITKDYE